jgi:hypothetical protein
LGNAGDDRGDRKWKIAKVNCSTVAWAVYTFGFSPGESQN